MRSEPVRVGMKLGALGAIIYRAFRVFLRVKHGLPHRDHSRGSAELPGEPQRGPLATVRGEVPRTKE